LNGAIEISPCYDPSAAEAAQLYPSYSDIQPTSWKGMTRSLAHKRRSQYPMHHPSSYLREPDGSEDDGCHMPELQPSNLLKRQRSRSEQRSASRIIAISIEEAEA
jgi:hypothetical protein